MKRDVHTNANRSRCQTAVSGLLVEGTRPDTKTHERELRPDDL